MFGRGAQSVDQFATGAAWQAMHPQRGLSGIIEVVDHIERKAVAVRQPFDEQRRLPCDSLNHRRIDLAIRLVRDVSSKRLRAVMDILGTLKSRARSRNQAR